MTSLKVALFFALISSVAFAQTQPTSEKAHDEKVWVEFGIPVGKNGAFKTAIDEQKLKSVGIGLSGGWQPLAAHNTDDGIIGALKNFGVIFGGSTNLLSPFNEYRYTDEERVTDVDSSCYSWDSYREDYYWDDTCYRCSRGGGYCQDNAVYGSDRYVKYETGMLFVGAMVPVQVADRLRLEGGLKYQWRFLAEGIIDNDLNTSTIGSLNTSIGAALQVNRNVALTGAYEFSVKGQKYKAYSFGVRWNLGRYF